MLSNIIHFIKTDIWRIRLKTLPRTRSFLIKQLRIILLSLRRFAEDKCLLRASALSFYSLLSIVPLLAMAFGIAKGFDLENRLEEYLLEKLPGQKEVVTGFIDFAHSLLEKTKGGMIAGIGVAVLLWTVIKVLGNIEHSFNDIWGIKRARNIGRKFSDYVSAMLICTILFIMSSSAVVATTGQVKIIMEKISLLGVFGSFIFAALKLLPYCIIWTLFSFIYIFMPNTKVNFKSGILAGIAAGTTYQVLQLVYINFQIGVAKYNAIYGSFTAGPLFLVWLQASWLIVLLGAEISFAHQNVDTYEFEPDCLRVSYSFKKLLALRIVHSLVKDFCKGEKPLTATQISQGLEIPIRLVRQILYELVESGIVSEVRKEEDKLVSYQPARGIEMLTIKYVIDALEKRGSDNIPVAKSDELDRISGCLKAFSEEAQKSSANTLLKEI